MVNFDSLESAREFFYKDKFAVNTGITLDELTEDEAICSLDLTDDHRNAYGGVMGGVIFTLAYPKLNILVKINDLFQPFFCL